MTSTDRAMDAESILMLTMIFGMISMSMMWMMWCVWCVWCVGGKRGNRWKSGNVSHKRAVAPKKPTNRASCDITSRNKGQQSVVTYLI